MLSLCKQCLHVPWYLRPLVKYIEFLSIIIFYLLLLSFLLQNTKIFNNNVALVCWCVVNLSFCHSFIVEDCCFLIGEKLIHTRPWALHILLSNIMIFFLSWLQQRILTVFREFVVCLFLLGTPCSVPLHLLLLSTSFHCHCWLCLGCVTGTPEAGAASRAIWVFPGFDATRVCLEHVHSGPDCPGDLFSHRKPLPEGQLLSQHGWIQTDLEPSSWAEQVSVQAPGPAAL